MVKKAENVHATPANVSVNMVYSKMPCGYDMLQRLSNNDQCIWF